MITEINDVSTLVEAVWMWAGRQDGRSAFAVGFAFCFVCTFLLDRLPNNLAKICAVFVIFLVLAAGLAMAADVTKALPGGVPFTETTRTPGAETLRSLP